jgi:polysaccharide export outer membrane protein
MEIQVMLRKITAACIVTFLSSCSILPGMNNLNTSAMPKRDVPQQVVDVNPVIVPITSSLITDQRVSHYVYHVAPADVLTISIWDHPEFQLPQATSGSTPSIQGAAGQAGYLVNPDGNIYFPLIGYVPVAEKTVDEIRALITLRLKKFVRHPEVNVRVADFRGQKVYVFGEVSKPGFLPLNDQPLTIVDALTLSGSIDSSTSDPAHIFVIRGNFSHPTIYWLNAKTPDKLLLAEHFNLQPGDVLYVSSTAASRWNRVLNQVLPTLNAVFLTKALTHDWH